MNKKNTPQRKTTLKWNPNGELSEIDMLRILEKISSDDLNQCELTCDSDQFWILLFLDLFKLLITQKIWYQYQKNISTNIADKKAAYELLEYQFLINEISIKT